MGLLRTRIAMLLSAPRLGPIRHTDMHPALPVFLTIGLALASLPTGIAPARASQDLTAEQLIEQLRPGTGNARAIRPNALGALSPLLQQANAPPGVSAANLYVLFRPGSAALTPGAERTLDQLGRALVSPVLHGYRYRIEGHTDGPGPQEQNVSLSAERAMAVRDYLVARFAMDPRQFDIIGLGATQPLVVAPPGTSEPLNRRVQVVNLGR